MEAIRRLYISQRPQLYKMWSSFLDKASIRAEKNVDYTCGYYDGDVLVGTGSLHKNIIKCVAIHCDYMGGSVFNQIITHLMNEITQRGYTQFYVYTKPKYEAAFNYLGFHRVSHVEDQLVFLERAVTGIDAYLEKLTRYQTAGTSHGAIVMNANPFTLGHQYLVETAAKQVDTLYVFVVAEDVSQFSFAVRKKLVEEGTQHLHNVVILSTGNYMVSSQTFPSYFLNENADVTSIHARLDATVFKERIAPCLSIRTRFLGEEPYSVATQIYNEALTQTLEPDIHVVIIPRKCVAQDAISATRVRALIEEGNLEAVKALVPDTTYTYLTSELGRK